MKYIGILICLFISQFKAVAQVVETPALTTQQLENTTAAGNDNETEDDSGTQQLEQLLIDPLNLNAVDANQLTDAGLVSQLQAEQLLLYRSLFGSLLSIYELQAVPLWSVELIQKIRPYITVSIETDLAGNLEQRFKKGKHTVLIRFGQVPERAKGYSYNDSTTGNYYRGSPQKILVRYKYVYKNQLQYGLLGEKDAGEQFLKGRQKAGFDFYSFHLFARDLGIVKAIALGDFVLNLGQGLLQWQSLAFKKSAEVLNIKREADVLRPYNSAGEVNFHRGIGITLQHRHWQASFFGSYKHIDGNLIIDSLQRTGDYTYISSLQTSGYHRTNAEIADKGAQQQLVVGANLSFQRHKLNLGLNFIRYKFKIPLQNQEVVYDQYGMKGRSFGNYSIDYGYTRKNLHFFGELAFDQRLDMALVSGLIASLSPTVDMSILYRQISRAYRAFYANAFTEASEPNNENGLYGGICLRPGGPWRIDAYADFFSFPWLKYRIDKPSEGSDLLVQATYRPNKQLEIYSRYHMEKKSINVNEENLALSPVFVQQRENWRTHISYSLNPAVRIDGRVDILWFNKKGIQAEEGFLAYFDLFYKPLTMPGSLSLRLQYFETEGYNSRIYAYENDVLYSYSVPASYDKGYRYYININYDLNKHITFWARWAQTLYKGKTLIGSGLDEIKGSTKSDARLQMMYRF